VSPEFGCPRNSGVPGIREFEAVSLLKNLRDLADMKGTSAEFSRQMTAMCGEHARKSSLIERFRTAKLLD
jgi:hypothetical protein